MGCLQLCGAILLLMIPLADADDTLQILLSAALVLPIIAAFSEYNKYTYAYSPF